MESKDKKNSNQALRKKLYAIIFGTESPAGKRFDIVLICIIILSVVAVSLDSIDAIAVNYKTLLIVAEWIFTIAFTLEYLVRIYCSPKPWAYIRSFYGVVDFLSIMPTYLTFFLPQASYLIVFRLLRVLRIFRVLKLARYIGETNVLLRSLAMSRRKVLVFFSSVLVLATIIGSLMFIVEGPENGFTSIPTSIYWSIVTITTVGYGDITPHTIIGKFLAAATMLIGYSIIAVPTGILTAEIASEIQRERNHKVCPNCNHSGHERDAKYCRVCGVKFVEKT
ncbi:MAG: ion transporter [Cellvibrionaceae bacterium]